MKDDLLFFFCLFETHILQDCVKRTTREQRALFTSPAPRPQPIKPLDTLFYFYNIKTKKRCFHMSSNSPTPPPSLSLSRFPYQNFHSSIIDSFHQFWFLFSFFRFSFIFRNFPTFANYWFKYFLIGSNHLSAACFPLYLGEIILKHKSSKRNFEFCIEFQVLQKMLYFSISFPLNFS